MSQIAFSNPQQSNFPVTSNNGNGNSNAKADKKDDVLAVGASQSNITAKTENSQSPNAVSASEKNEETTALGTTTELTRKHKRNGKKGSLVQTGQETETRASRGKKIIATKLDRSDKASKTAKANDKGGVTSAANERANKNSSAALSAQNRSGLSGDNLIALQSSDGKADKLAARLDQANGRVEAEAGTKKVEDVKADDAPVATQMSEITSNILKDADMVLDADAQKVEQNETLMSAIDEVQEKDETSKDKQDKNGGIETLAA